MWETHYGFKIRDEQLKREPFEFLGRKLKKKKTCAHTFSYFFWLLSLWWHQQSAGSDVDKWCRPYLSVCLSVCPRDSGRHARTLASAESSSPSASPPPPPSSSSPPQSITAITTKHLHCITTDALARAHPSGARAHWRTMHRRS